ncbi:MAG: hypothetical protein RLZZ396_3007 [Planctomycetota bacterium]|jgi:hypothetical protein
MNGNDAAYPSDPDQYSPEFGLTKRELFAAMALQGLLADPYSTQEFTIMASMSVQVADALITELSKEVKGDK